MVEITSNLASDFPTILCFDLQEMHADSENSIGYSSEQVDRLNYCSQSPFQSQTSVRL